MKSKLIRASALMFLTIFSLPLLAANFYRCETSNGRVTFSDKPCPKTAKTTDQGKLRSFRISGTVGKEEYTDDAPEPDPQSVLIFRSKFTGILESLTPLRTTINQYYMERGKWPENMEALGFDQQAMSSRDVDSVKIKKNGRVIAKLNSRHGENKIIVLAPIPAMGNTKLDWQCWSNYPSSLLGRGELEICGSRIIF
jgi:hypothetical protein